MAAHVQLRMDEEQKAAPEDVPQGITAEEVQERQENV